VSHVRMSAAEQSPAHRLSNGTFVIFEQVPVNVLGDSDAGMSEGLRDHVQWRALEPASATPQSGATRGGCQ
jgi:hypothetical protein